MKKIDLNLEANLTTYCMVHLLQGVLDYYGWKNLSYADVMNISESICLDYIDGGQFFYLDSISQEEMHIRLCEKLGIRYLVPEVPLDPADLFQAIKEKIDKEEISFVLVNERYIEKSWAFDLITQYHYVIPVGYREEEQKFLFKGYGYSSYIELELTVDQLVEMFELLEMETDQPLIYFFEYDQQERVPITTQVKMDSLLQNLNNLLADQVETTPSGKISKGKNAVLDLADKIGSFQEYVGEKWVSQILEDTSLTLKGLTAPGTILLTLGNYLAEFGEEIDQQELQMKGQGLNALFTQWNLVANLMVKAAFSPEELKLQLIQTIVDKLEKLAVRQEEELTYIRDLLLKLSS